MSRSSAFYHNHIPTHETLVSIPRNLCLRRSASHHLPQQCTGLPSFRKYSSSIAQIFLDGLFLVRLSAQSFPRESKRFLLCSH